MKKLIIIIALFIITMPFYSQTIDTSAWAFKTVGGDGTYRLLENRSTYLGKSAGTVVIPLQFDVNGVDTANWGFLPIGSDGTFRLVYNKETFYGKDSGTVVAQLVYPIDNSTGTATTSSGVATLNTLSGVVTTDNMVGSGGTITINNSHVSATSIIVATLQYLEAADIVSTSIIVHGISEINSGSFVYKIVNNSEFTGQLKLHFKIINP